MCEGLGVVFEWFGGWARDTSTVGAEPHGIEAKELVVCAENEREKIGADGASRRRANFEGIALSCARRESRDQVVGRIEPRASRSWRAGREPIADGAVPSAGVEREIIAREPGFEICEARGRFHTNEQALAIERDHDMCPAKALGVIGGKSAPGFKMPFGSNARFIAR